MTLNDIATRIAEELIKEHDKEFGNICSGVYANKNMYNAYSNEERDRALVQDGYEKATEVVRKTLYKIVSEEIKSKNLDFIL